MVKVVVDLLGADNKPKDLISGAIKAANENKDLYLYVCAPKEEIESEVKAAINKNVEIIDCNEAITNYDKPVKAFKTKPNSSLVKGLTFTKENADVDAFVSCGSTGAVLVSAAQKLAEVAVETAKTANYFGIDPKVAVLSFSTYGSGKGGTVQLSHDAVIEARKLNPELVIDGEFQFDAAVSEVVAKTKCPDSKVAGQANTFIFPLIEAGNIGYKIAQRLGGYEAYGPILQGLNAPINDLSRGCNADEVYKMAIITAGMAE